jgi:hypothetical protein
MRSFFERYRNGEHAAVWEELVALGEGVRNDLYYADAVAVANETMSRVRHNVETLIQRLAEMGYYFVTIVDLEVVQAAHRKRPLHDNIRNDPGKLAAHEAFESRVAQEWALLEVKLKRSAPLQNRDVFDPPSERTEADLDKLEKTAGGPLPVSLRAWYEQVGSVSLIGWHDVINPGDTKHPSDPLMVGCPSEILPLFDPTRDLPLCVAPDPLHKANIGGGAAYTITIPNKCADAPFEYERHQTTFVNYLRNALDWAGFPGWEREKNPPLETIAKLQEGFLPF